MVDGRYRGRLLSFVSGANFCTGANRASTFLDVMSGVSYCAERCARHNSSLVLTLARENAAIPFVPRSKRVFPSRSQAWLTW